MEVRGALLEPVSEISREQAREKLFWMLDLRLEAGTGSGGKVAEVGAWLLAHAGMLYREADDEATYTRVSAAAHALIACRHKQVFGTGPEQDMAGVARACREIARLYATVAEELEGTLPPAEWADPKPSWKTLQLAVLGAGSEGAACLRNADGRREAEECSGLGSVLLEVGAQMSLQEGEEAKALEAWAAVAIMEFPLGEDFDPMRLVPLAHFAGLAATLEEIAQAYTIGRDYEWAFTPQVGA